MGFVWGLLGGVFIGIYVLVHRARVRAMRGYIERGPWGDNPPGLGDDHR